jgi:4-hydroxy-2-oxoheptanedioate aldolase
MFNQRLRDRWRSGQVAVDCWLSGTSALNAEAIGRLGFDSVLIDMQHSMIGLTEVGSSLLALTGTGTTSIVRVPGNDSSIIQRVLDAGADGVMCPMVNNRAEAERFVSAVRYPPLGTRSIGPYRTGGSLVEYFRGANEQIIAAVQIETVEAMSNIEEIAATRGLDLLFAGPADLAVSYGGEPVVDYGDQDTEDRHRRIAEAAHAAGKYAGMLTVFDEQDTRRAIGWGYDMVSVAAEAALVQAGALKALGAGRQLADRRAELLRSGQGGS